MPIREGIGELTYQEYLVGPGAVYVKAGAYTNAEPGTCLGETKGGNTFEVIPTYHEYEPDGALGHLKNHTVISSVVIRLTANLYGVTLANLARLLPGSAIAENDIVHVPTEWGILAVEGAAQSFTPFGAAAIVFSTLKVYTDDGTNIPVLLVEDTDYTVNTATGEITEITTQWDDDSNILVEYDYTVATGANYSTITLDKIDGDDYIQTVAIVGEVSDIVKTEDAVLIVKNALCMNGVTLSLPGGSKEAAVMTAIFEGHWDPAEAITLANAPFEIRYSTQS